MPKRLYFPFKRLTSGDADRVVDDPVGNFSCLPVTANFLDIEKLAIPVVRTKKVKPTKIRTLNRADGSLVVRNPKNPSGIPQEYDASSRLSKGTRRVVLTTGKKIDARIADSRATYHTISFRFPSFATVLTISDALGTLIPSGKIKVKPTAADISPYFKVAGGGLYSIMQKAAAESSTEAKLGLTIAQIKELGGDVENIGVYPGAGV